MFSEEIQAKLSATYKDTTMKNVKTCIRKLYGYLNTPLEQYKKDIVLNNIQQVLSFLDTLTIGVAKCYCGYIVKLLSFDDISHKKLNERLSELYKKDDEKRQGNKDEELIKIDVKAIYDYFRKLCFSSGTYIDKRNPNRHIVREKCRKPTETKLNRLVLFSILNNCAMRLTEMTNMLYEDDGVSNYIDFENKQLVIRIHKNKGKTRFIKLTDQTIEDIKLSRKHIESKYLFCKKGQDDKDISNDVYGLEGIMRVAIKEFNKEHGIEHKKGKMGIHGLRHNAVSRTYEELNVNLDAIKQILSLCDSLGNSIGTQVRDYLKKI